MRTYRTLGFVLALAAGPVFSLHAQTAPPRDAVMWSAILSSEDSRPTMAQALGPMAGGLRYPDPEVRRLAVRGLGRLEKDTVRAPKGMASLVDLIAQVLSDSSAAVRAEAANAMAQAVQHSYPDAARDTLLAYLKTERDPLVRGEIAQALGRLPYKSSPQIEAALFQASADTALPTVLGAARAYDSFSRSLGRNGNPSAETVTRLNQLARFTGRGRTTSAARTDSVARVRRLAVTALLTVRRLDAATINAAAADADAQVRRLAIVALGVLDSTADRSRLVTAALRDASPIVRWEALRVYGQRLQATAGCNPILQSLGDKSPHVVLEAIDLLGSGCEAALKAQANDRLQAFANQLAPAYGIPSSSQTWHHPAHALVALSQSAPDRAETLLPRFSGHSTWWVRMYAARAATNLKQTATLNRLAYDENDNVREAAITGLSAVSGHGADSAYIAALARKDYQLMITASKALDSTPNRERALSALNASLQRVTAENRETSRDARMAVLQRIGALGGPAQVSQIQLYLYDWDPAIAGETAKILSKWAGTPQEPTPTSLEYPKLPSLGRVVELSRSRAVFHMRGGGTFEMSFRPLDAPTNVDRFARLVASNYFDGLTFHRAVPNFVLQGGSPGANEYWGDGPFTRDELTTQEHIRGTVGISTRGHDTGDGQIYVNLVDNPRLDHQYTIIGEITTGMDVVDGLLEGATIEKVEILTSPAK